MVVSQLQYLQQLQHLARRRPAAAFAANFAIGLCISTTDYRLLTKDCMACRRHLLNAPTAESRIRLVTED